MQFIRGQKAKLSDVLTTQKAFSLQVDLNSPLTIDVSVFGLDTENHLSDEAYMIFYN